MRGRGEQKAFRLAVHCRVQMQPSERTRIGVCKQCITDLIGHLWAQLPLSLSACDRGKHLCATAVTYGNGVSFHGRARFGCNAQVQSFLSARRFTNWRAWQTAGPVGSRVLRLRVIVLALFHLYDYFRGALKLGETVSFCRSCHEMKQRYRELTRSVHFSNVFGIQASCGECHKGVAHTLPEGS